MSENKDISPEELKDILHFVLRPGFFCLASKKCFNELPEELQSRALKVTDELLHHLDLRVLPSMRELYAFTSESTYYRGVHKLRESGPFREVELRNIFVPPGVFFRAVSRLEPAKIEFDFASPSAALSLEKAEDIKAFVRVAMLAHYAELDEFWVVSDAKNFAISLDHQGKVYAAAFLDEFRGKPIVDALSQAHPGCHLDGNSPLEMAKRVLSSTFAGVILNPGPEQSVLSREDLKILLQACRLLRPPFLSPGWFLNKFIK